MNKLIYFCVLSFLASLAAAVSRVNSQSRYAVTMVPRLFHNLFLKGLASLVKTVHDARNSCSPWRRLACISGLQPERPSHDQHQRQSLCHERHHSDEVVEDSNFEIAFFPARIRRPLRFEESLLHPLRALGDYQARPVPLAGRQSASRESRI